MDRNIYGDHELTIARHPSETDERMLMRVLAYALNVPADREKGDLVLAKSLWDVDEPDLWQVDLTGQVIHWIEVGQPDDRRLAKASSRAEKVTVYSYIASTPIWWAALVGKLNRAPKVEVWSDRPRRVAGAGQDGGAHDGVADHGAGRHGVGVGHGRHRGDHAQAAEGARRARPVLELKPDARARRVTCAPATRPSTASAMPASARPVSVSPNIAHAISAVVGGVR